jgi:hypothetical protein
MLRDERAVIPGQAQKLHAKPGAPVLKTGYFDDGKAVNRMQEKASS